MIEKKLIDECREGNLNNFRKVIEITSPFAFSVAFRMLGHEEQAQDIVQDTMVTIWKKLRKIKSSESYKTWVYKIVVNKCNDQLRRRKRQSELRLDDQGWALIANHISEETTSEIENKEIARIVNLLTQKLSPKQKTVFVLSELEEMSNDEISRITGMSKTIIKANLYYGRKHIAGLIEKYL